MRSANVWTVVALAAAVGCGGGNYVLVENGGVDVPQGACADVTIAPDMALVAQRAPDCEKREGHVLAVHATAAFWRVGTGPWAGPVIAGSASVEAAVVHPLEGNASTKSLVSGSSATGLQSGSSDRGLVAGASDKGLQSGVSDKGLQSGASSSGLRSGASDRGLQSSASDKALQSGASDKGLVSGSGAVAPLTIEKHGAGRATAEQPARFVVTVTNVSDVELSAVTVVDRVDPSLRVAGATEATPVSDGSTVVTFRSNAPLGPHATRSFDIDVYPR